MSKVFPLKNRTRKKDNKLRNIYLTFCIFTLLLFILF